MRGTFLGLGLAALVSSSAPADTVTVAVAANFAEALERLAPEFEDTTGHQLRTVVGSTGKLFAQVHHGAEIDVFLSADAERPRRLELEGLAVPGSRFTYAVGRLALWSPEPDRFRGDGRTVLASGGLRSLAVANPDLAPYGTAAAEVLDSLGVWDEWRGRAARGENVGQAFAMAASGNADGALVALSSVLGAGNAGRGSWWTVPEELHAPIRQDAVLLARAADSEAARAFLAFLAGDRLDPVLVELGYARPRP